MEKGNVFWLKTVQSNSIKVLLDSLKDFLDIVTIRIDNSGLKMLYIDGSATVMAHLKLNAESFEEFYCKEETDITLSIPHMYKMLKTMGNNDVLTLTMEPSAFQLTMIIENEQKKLKDISKLNLRDQDSPALSIEDIDFDSINTISSNIFKKYCSDLSVISDRVKITIDEDSFSMFSTGDIGEKKIIMHETETGISFNKRTDDVIEHEFSLSFLSMFARSANLCSELQIFMKNNKPLVLVYQIANLGTLKYLLASYIDE